MILTFRPGGVIEFIYDDATALLLMDLGSLTIRRASRVEPAENGQSWTADLSILNGPILGPFALRKEALDAEVKWIEDNYLTKGKS